MKYIDIQGIKLSRLALGCMRIADKPIANVERLVNTALDIGVNLFDHSDIYGGGTCERKYGELIARDRSLRPRMVLQTKCGIRDRWYDLSREHIIEAVNGSLERLNTDYVDILLLHRPDTLMCPDEVARAFEELHSSGKVRLFGVSNFSAQQMELLQRSVGQKLLFDQLQLSPAYCPMIDQGIHVNTPEACDRDGGILEYSRLNGITIQTYGTMQCRFTDEDGHVYEGAFTSEQANKKYFALNFMLNGLAQKYGVSPEAIAVSWVLRHPAEMIAIVGTTHEEHMRNFDGCCEVPLTGKEWYNIYAAAGHTIP